MTRPATSSECLRPLCPLESPHVHVAIPVPFVDRLTRIATREDMDPRAALRRVEETAALLLVENGHWFPRALTVPVDAGTDRILNRRRPWKILGGPYVLAQTIVAMEVLRQCEKETLESSLLNVETRARAGRLL